MISISGYKNLQPIYKGATTMVSSAIEESTGREVVLKYPRPQSATLDRITQFHTEFQILSRLDSKYAVEVIELIESDGLPVIIIEKIDLRPLANLLADKVPEQLDILRLAQELTTALDEIHACGVVYKNLNPGNILVDENFSNPRLVGFGLAAFDNALIEDDSNSVLEGMAEYMSPEQTGRMNRTLDYRTDIYSLGAVLYELAAGAPPFDSEDFLELIYQHLARVPEPPSTINPSVPKTLDSIILKLLVKEPEDRYQSTYAVSSDLKRAADLYLVNPEFEGEFTVALDDVSEQLSLPNKLYDRDLAINQLRVGIKKAQAGAVAPIAINGEAGTGKTALLQTLSELILETGGTLCLQRATLVNKDIPLSTVMGLLVETSRQLLSRNDLPELQGRLQASLGQQLEQLTTVAPDLQRVANIPLTTPQTRTPFVTKNRIREALINFLKVVAEFTRPLIIAIDNAYWIDEASIELLTDLARQDISGLLIIFAGRPISGPDQPDFESFHNLTERIYIGNLDQSQLKQLLSSTTFRSTEEVEDLASVVLAKTEGNPQFVREFLQDLYRDGNLFFDRNHREWTWNLDAINVAQPTNNVGSVLANRLNSLDRSTIEVLKIAACIGDQFDLDTVRRVSGHSFSKTSACLIQAVAEGFLLYSDATKKSVYTFAHEQIQQAAYKLLESIERHQIHAQIGKTYLMLDDSDDRIFEVVNQLNNSLDGDTSLEERMELARLNLAAGRKAKNSAAFQASFRYLRTAIAVQGKDVWNDYQLSFDTHVEAAEAAYFCGDRDQLELLITAMISRADNILDKAKAYEIQLRALVSQNELDLALEIGHEVLQLLECPLPNSITPTQLFFWTLRTLFLARSGAPNKKEMVDPKKLAAMKILMILSQAGYMAGTSITAIYTLKMTELSIKEGLAPESSFAYPLFGAFIIRYFGTINLGYEFGQLALANLSEAHEDMTCRTNVIVHNFVSFWKQHLRATLDPLAQAEKIGFEQGDIEFAQMAGTTSCVNGFIVGQDLMTLDASFTKRNASASEFNQLPMFVLGCLFQQVVQNLMRNPENPWLLRGSLFDEDEMIPLHRKEQDFTSLANVYVAKTFLAFLFREFDTADKYAEQARLPLESLVSSPLIPFFTTFETLILIQQQKNNYSLNSLELWYKIRRNITNLRKWAQHAPMNTSSGYHLVLAEYSRVNRRHTEAQQHYETSISLAEKYGHTHLLAIAEELTGRFYDRNDQTSLATYYLLRARSSFVRWGAITKVNLLDQEFSELAEQGSQYVRRPRQLIDSTESAYTHQLDLSSVIKASQALSGEIILDTLLEKLMQVALENAGAHSAGLVLSEGEELQVEIQSKFNGATTDHKRQREKITNCYDLPASVIQYVARTQEDLVLNDAASEDMFTQDSYISRVKPRSILCFPILSKSHLTGVLYLENLQSKGAFSEDRVAVLKLLASQSAIAIENAKLYRQLNESRNKYLSLYENAVEGIFEINMKGELLSLNPAAAQLMGHPDWGNTTNLKVDFEQFYVEPENMRAFTRRLLKEHRVVGFETRLKRLDNREIWVAISAHVRFEGDVPLKIDGSIIDITERKLRQQAEQATRLAEAATETKSQFLANMSHEIRTPMNAILGYTRLALDTPLNEQQDSYLRTIKNSSDHLLRVVNDILDISKIESGKLELQNIDFELQDVLNDVYQLFKLEAEGKGLAFHMSEASGKYVGDSVRLGQVLINLVSNAIKFTEYGRVEVNLEVLPLHDGTHCLNFIVQDTGCGIAEDQNRSIFDAFTQSYTAKNEEGTGLGLAIAKSIVQKMQGHIHVSSQPGVGSKFFFTVVLEPAVGSASPTLQTEKVSNTSSSQRLLLVEDNPINRSLATEVLTGNGYEVIEAENGKIALQLLEREKVFAVLMDLRMPIMGGNEAIQHIRSNEKLKGLPVIALSAGVLQHEIDAALDNGFDRYITKPVDFKKLLDTLADLGPPATSSAAPATVSSVVFRNVNFTKALRNHDGDESLLLKLLQDFVAYYQDAPQTLQSALNENDIEKAVRLTHNLAGLAGTFGDEALMKISRGAEKQIQQEQILSTDNLEEFQSAFANLLLAIEDFSAERKQSA